MRVPDAGGRLLKVRALGIVAPYAAIVLLAPALFFLLHHLGNQIPYDLAQQRFRAEYAAVGGGRQDAGVVGGWSPGCEYCELSESVMAGAKRAGEESAFRDAVMLRTFPVHDPGYCCYELDVAAHGGDVREVTVRTRYWWGSKALWAIALRYLSVHQIRELTRISIRIAYLLLAVSLVLLVPGALPAAAPLLVFGAFFSGVEYWSDAANGLPYLWTVLSAASLAWLMRVRPPSGVFSGAVPVHCFAVGAVSSYLWLADSHTFLAITWIGLLVWFGHDAPNAAERTRRAASCVALYAAGFLACYGVGQVVKAVVGGYGLVWATFWSQVSFILERSVAEVSEGPAAHLSGYVETFYAMVWPGWLPGGVVSTSAAVSALAVSVGFASFQARRGRVDPLRGVLWIAALTSINGVNFLMAEDIPPRTARFMFVPLALCWSCLVLAVRTMDWKRSSAMLGVVAAVSGAVSWSVSSYVAASNARAMDELIAGVGDSRPIIRSTFDVYLDGNRLVYVKEECGAEDVDARFFLHFYPVDAADLPNRVEPLLGAVAARPRRLLDAADLPNRVVEPYGFDNLDFVFHEAGRRGGGRCAAAIVLPEYEIADIHTGQFMPGWNPEWSERVSIADPRAIDAALASVEDTQPIIGSTFDVYLDGNRLVYVKDACGDEDVDARFFLHLYPVDAADLPEPRRPHGFDNLDFAFERYGLRARGRCAATRVLPEYEVASVHTGQFVLGHDPDWDEMVQLEARSAGLDR